VSPITRATERGALPADRLTDHPRNHSPDQQVAHPAGADLAARAPAARRANTADPADRYPKWSMCTSSAHIAAHGDMVEVAEDVTPVPHHSSRAAASADRPWLSGMTGRLPARAESRTSRRPTRGQLLHPICLNSASPLLARVCAVADTAGTRTGADHAAEMNGPIRVRDERSLPKKKVDVHLFGAHRPTW